MKFLAVIPARYGSSRFPGKPLADIMGMPMIQRVYERTASVFANVAVATDDSRIYDRVISFGGRAVMTSDRHNSGTDRCFEALGLLEKQDGTVYDVIVNVQGDEPFISPEQLGLLASCFDRENVEVATLVKKISDERELFDENKPKVVLGADMNAIYFSRLPIPFCRGKKREEWLADTVYYKHIGLYGYRRDILERISAMPSSSLENAERLEQLRWLENGIRIAVAVTDIETCSVDRPEDILTLERLFGN